jgi:uncharacterized phage protein (predicted DNA packaging)
MVEEVKQYLRIDGSEDDVILASFIAAAKSFVKNATGVEVVETNELHKLAVKLLVANYYENRLPVGDEKSVPLPYSLESILFQIGYAGEVTL